MHDPLKVPDPFFTHAFIPIPVSGLGLEEPSKLYDLDPQVPPITPVPTPTLSSGFLDRSLLDYGCYDGLRVASWMMIALALLELLLSGWGLVNWANSFTPSSSHRDSPLEGAMKDMSRTGLLYYVLATVSGSAFSFLLGTAGVVLWDIGLNVRQHVAYERHVA